MAVNILHISDLHRAVRAPTDNQALFGHLRDDIQIGYRDHNDRSAPDEPRLGPPDLIVISGDLTQHAEPGEYAVALDFMERLLALVDGDRSRIVLVPGNHDVNWTLSRQAYGKSSKRAFESQVKVDEPYTRSIVREKSRNLYWRKDETLYPQRFAPFKDFFDRFYQGLYTYSLDREKQFTIFDYGRRYGLVIVGFNSCDENDHLAQRAYINVNAIDNAVRQDSFHAQDPALTRIAVFHHDIRPMDYGDDYLDPKYLRKLVSHRLNLCLHGHVHDAKDDRFLDTREKSLPLIGAGSLAAPYADRPPAAPKEYNLLSIDARGGRLVVHCRRQDEVGVIWEPDYRWNGKSYFAVENTGIPAAKTTEEKKMTGERDDVQMELDLAKEFLAVLGKRAAGYAPPDVPERLKKQIHEQKQKVSELQARLDALEHPPIETPSRVSMNVPEPGPNFVGREAEVAEVYDALPAWPVVVLEGMGGIGKSTLAKKIANELWQKHAFDPIVWVTAEDAPLSLNTIIDMIADLLGRPYVKQLPHEERLKEIDKLLRAQRCLLIVDGLENVRLKDLYDPIRKFLEEPRTPSRVLVTTRLQSQLSGKIVRLDGLTQKEALDFIHSEGRRTSVPSLTLLNLEDIDQLYNTTGGAPLALTWAVGQVVALGEPLNSVVEKIKQARGNVDIYEDIFSVGWTSLGRPGKRIFKAMSVFEKDASPSAIQAVGDLSGAEYAEGRRELVTMSFVRTNYAASPADERISLHPLARNFAGSQLDRQNNEPERLETRAKDYFLDLARDKGPLGWQGYKALRAEKENLWAVIEWCRQRGKYKDIIDFMFNTRSFLEAYGEHSKVVEFGLEILSEANHGFGAPLDDSDVAWFHYLIGRALFRTERFDEVQMHIQKAHDLFEKLRNADGLANAMRYQAKLAAGEGDWDQAREIWSRGLESAREEARQAQLGGSDPRAYEDLVARFINDLGRLEFKQRHYPEAFKWHQEALNLSRTRNDQEGIAFATGCLGNLEVARGDLDRAREYFEESLKLNLQYERPLGVAHTYLGQARLEEKLGDIEKASRLALQAKEMYENLGMVTEASRAEQMLRGLSRNLNHA